MTSFPRISSTKRTRLSPWVTILENRVIARDGDAEEIHHAVEVADYVSVLAIASDGRIQLVRQFRQAVNRFTLEFPGGLVDAGENPEQCAVRELAEETGLQAGKVMSLGSFLPESGRLANRMWGFVTTGATPVSGWRASANSAGDLP